MKETNIEEIIKEHERSRERGLNLIASENILSEGARKALSSDLAGRYHSDYYGGTKHVRRILRRTEKLAEDVFGVKHAFIKPISGNICDLNVLFSFTKPDDKIAMLPFDKGGYPLGLEKFNRKRVDLPSKKNSYEIDPAKSKKACQEEDPDLYILGSSYIPFPHPVKEFSRMIPDEKRPLIFDGSHVLGLIATSQFQSPLKEGADILLGSTHKSFYGPQGGLILTNNDDLAERVRIYQDIDLDTGIGLIDNPHVNRIAALGITLEEIKRDKKYGARVVKNAKGLASSLDDQGVPMRFSEKGYTESHQIFLDMDWETSKKFCRELEGEDIFIDISGRIGTAEVTRRGMDESDMEKIAHQIAEIYRHFQS